MKHKFAAAALILSVLCLAFGCGNKKAENTNVKVTVEAVNRMSDEELENLYQGKWQTSIVFVDNTEDTLCETDTYEFLEDGTGSYTPEKGEAEIISWKISVDGDLEVLFEEKGEKLRTFECVSGNLVSHEKEERGMVDTYLIKLNEEDDEEADEEDGEEAAEKEDKGEIEK